jgi:hypothetical protein
MRVLLDECVPLQIRDALPSHDVTTAQRMGWGGKSNGDLLTSAELAGLKYLSSQIKIFGISKIYRNVVSRFWSCGQIIGLRWKSIL